MKKINNKLKFVLLFIIFVCVILTFKRYEGFGTPISLGNLLTSQGEPADIIPTRQAAVNFNVFYESGGLTSSTYNSMTGTTSRGTQGVTTGGASGGASGSTSGGASGGSSSGSFGGSSSGSFGGSSSGSFGGSSSGSFGGSSGSTSGSTSGGSSGGASSGSFGGSSSASPGGSSSGSSAATYVPTNIQEITPPPTTDTISTITYVALSAVLVGGIGYASFLALKVI
jgi:hypothetical protein